MAKREMIKNLKWYSNGKKILNCLYLCTVKLRRYSCLYQLVAWDNKISIVFKFSENCIGISFHEIKGNMKAKGRPKYTENTISVERIEWHWNGFMYWIMKLLNSVWMLNEKKKDIKKMESKWEICKKKKIFLLTMNDNALTP